MRRTSFTGEPDFLGNLAIAYEAVDRLDESIDLSRRALAIRPQAATYANLGLALLEQGHHGDAIAAYPKH
jgi:tetratricopeptide (TPR) repeat protein